MKNRIFIFSLLFSVGITLFAQNDNYNTRVGIQLFQEKSYSAALDHLQKAAKEGSTQAMDFLGYMYEQGLGVITDYTIALNLYNRAAALKYGPAIVSIGRLYEHGRGVTKEPAKAYSYYKQAADLKEAEGQYQVSLCKYYGFGTEKDLSKAVQYAELAANNGWGYEHAAYLLYENREYEKAFHWYTRPECTYSDESKARLMLFYIDGVVAPKNYRKAKKLLDELNSSGYKGLNIDSINQAIIRPLSQQIANEEREEKRERRSSGQEVVAVASGPLASPQFSEAIKAYIRSFGEPQKPAIESAGRGEIVIACYVSSSGQVSGATIKYRVLQRLDNEALRLVQGMPPLKPGTQGGSPVNMRAQIGVSFFPLNVRLVNYNL